MSALWFNKHWYLILALFLFLIFWIQFALPGISPTGDIERAAVGDLYLMRGHSREGDTSFYWMRVQEVRSTDSLVLTLNSEEFKELPRALALRESQAFLDPKTYTGGYIRSTKQQMLKMLKMEDLVLVVKP